MGVSGSKLPRPDASFYVRLPGLPERAGAGAVVLRRAGAGWEVAVVVEPDGERQLPKGGVEAGETHLDALYRELLEEAGLREVVVVADLGVQERQNYARTRWQVTQYFLGVTAAEAVTPLEPGFSLEWHPLDAAPELFWPEQTRLVEEVRRGLAAGRWTL